MLMANKSKRLYGPSHAFVKHIKIKDCKKSSGKSMRNLWRCAKGATSKFLVYSVKMILTKKLPRPNPLRLKELISILKPLRSVRIITTYALKGASASFFYELFVGSKFLILPILASNLLSKGRRLLLLIHLRIW